MNDKALARRLIRKKRKKRKAFDFDEEIEWIEVARERDNEVVELFVGTLAVLTSLAFIGSVLYLAYEAFL